MGDWLSYWLGIRIGRPIAKMWPLSRHPKLLPNAEAFVRRWGAPAIVIGRFFGPLRECAAGRRHFSHALLAVSDREFRFGHPLGGDTAHGWGRGQFSPRMGVGLNGFYFTAIRSAVSRVSKGWR